MTISNELEKTAWEKDKFLVGVDEAGFGCVCGNCYVAAVVFAKNYDFQKYLSDVNDSKKLSEKKRNELAGIILKEATCAVGHITPEEIDEGSLYHLRFDKARELANWLVIDKQFGPAVVVMDGNRKIKDFQSFNIESTCLTKGDSKSFTIAAASILAKVAKDAEMRKLHEKFPMYSFASNKGYATKAHQKAIEKHGLCEAHRETYCTKFELATNTGE